MSRRFIWAVAGLLSLLVIILAAAFIFVLQDISSSETEAVPTPASTAVVQVRPTDPPTSTPLPPPVVEVPPTFTIRPTITPANTQPPPTAGPTDEPTGTIPPLPTNTWTPSPTIFVPTNTPAPPPTNTPIPSPTPLDSRGLVLNHFALQDRSVYAINQMIWFEWDIANTTGGDIFYGALGVMPRREGLDRPDLVKISWGGNPNDVIPPQGHRADDHIELPSSGGYTLRLVICFEVRSTCEASGPWVTLSQEIAFFIP